MIARTWRGSVRADDAEGYLDYLRQTGLAGYAATPGNLGALALRRITDGQAEYLVISFWESEEAIRSFAGDDPQRAVFYPEDERFLVERDEHVDHYEIVHSGWDAAGPGGSMPKA